MLITFYLLSMSEEMENDLANVSGSDMVKVEKDLASLLHDLIVLTYYIPNGFTSLKGHLEFKTSDEVDDRYQLLKRGIEVFDKATIAMIEFKKDMIYLQKRLLNKEIEDMETTLKDLTIRSRNMVKMYYIAVTDFCNITKFFSNKELLKSRSDDNNIMITKPFSFGSDYGSLGSIFDSLLGGCLASLLTGDKILDIVKGRFAKLTAIIWLLDITVNEEPFGDDRSNLLYNICWKILKNVKILEVDEMLHVMMATQDMLVRFGDKSILRPGIPKIRTRALLTNVCIEFKYDIDYACTVSWKVRNYRLVSDSFEEIMLDMPLKEDEDIMWIFRQEVNHADMEVRKLYMSSPNVINRRVISSQIETVFTASRTYLKQLVREKKFDVMSVCDMSDILSHVELDKFLMEHNSIGARVKCPQMEGINNKYTYLINQDSNLNVLQLMGTSNDYETAIRVQNKAFTDVKLRPSGGISNENNNNFDDYVQSLFDDKTFQELNPNYYNNKSEHQDSIYGMMRNKEDIAVKCSNAFNNNFGIFGLKTPPAMSNNPTYYYDREKVVNEEIDNNKIIVASVNDVYSLDTTFYSLGNSAKIKILNNKLDSISFAVVNQHKPECRMVPVRVLKDRQTEFTLLLTRYTNDQKTESEMNGKRIKADVHITFKNYVVNQDIVYYLLEFEAHMSIAFPLKNLTEEDANFRSMSSYWVRELVFHLPKTTVIALGYNLSVADFFVGDYVGFRELMISKISTPRMQSDNLVARLNMKLDQNEDPSKGFLLEYEMRCSVEDETGSTQTEKQRCDHLERLIPVNLKTEFMGICMRNEGKRNTVNGILYMINEAWSLSRSNHRHSDNYRNDRRRNEGSYNNRNNDNNSVWI